MTAMFNPHPAASLGTVADRLQGLHIRHSLERSVKFTPGRVIADRYLLGIFKNLLTPASVQAILSINANLGLPPQYLPEIQARIGRADWLLMGQELDDQVNVQKFYLEYNNALSDQSAYGSDPEPVRLHDGYKWSPDCPTASRRAYYDCFPGISRQKMTERISAILNGPGCGKEMRFVEDFLNRAIEVIPVSEMIYLEVSEDDSARKSFDIAIHKAKLRVSDYLALFADLARHYEANNIELTDHMKPYLSAPLGHFSGGLDRHGNPFVTLYYSL